MPLNLETNKEKLIFAVTDQDGNILQTFDEGIPVIEFSDPIPKYSAESIMSPDTLEITCTVKWRNKRGFFDDLFCMDTMSAYRWRRSVKRAKEKKRRQRLKTSL